MGLFGLLGNIGRDIGHGVVGGIDRMASNALGGGLLGSAATGYGLPSSGLLAQNPTAQYDPNEGGMVTRLQAQPPAPQQFQPTKEQTRALRSQFLLNIGAALQQGRPLAEGIQNYQQQVVGELQANRAQQLQDQKQAMTAAFQQEMQQAGGNLQAQQQIVAKYAPVIGAQQASAYAALFKGMQPEKDEVIGEPFPGVDRDGKRVLLQHTKGGQIIPVKDYAPPQPNIQAAGNGILFNPETGLTSPFTMSVDGKPQTVVLDVRKHQYTTPDGVPLPPTALITNYKEGKPSLTGAERAYMKQAGGDPDDENTWTPQVLAKFKAITKPDKPESDTALYTALDRETKQFGAKHEKAVADANSQLEKIADARAMINGNAEAQALGIPKVLTALVSGQGSGVRITQPELNGIASARGVAGDFAGWLNSVSGKGKLTATQQQQLTAILNDVQARLIQKRDISNSALSRINGAGSRADIIAADNDARAKLSTFETPQAPAVHGIPGVGSTFNGGKVLKVERVQ